MNSPEKNDINLIHEGNKEKEPQNIAERKVARQKNEIPLVKAFLFAAAFWLIIGTLAGQIVAFKFIWPEFLNTAWLSFGRLRPIHTNLVFWGWASLAMLGLGYFVVPVASNTKLYSVKIGWVSFVLINISVITGLICLFFGFNNGMQEYREFIWPVMGVFILAVLLSTINFYITISRREVKEIYISNWFIMGASLWTLTFLTISYLPFYQKGLGETIIQGYYMHMAVGMWFMTFTLGLVYYFLPHMMDQPIFSHKLGILAFWTQMVFYAMIGTHHFIFSPIPWWMQTVAIVYSIGMVVPVVASTANFGLTIHHSNLKIRQVPGMKFILVGIIFYFIGSMQGSLEAPRYFNVMWHFTDYTIAHSHMTMYGIITFFLWGMTYGIISRLADKKPDKKLINLHFWLALSGLLIYTVALMIGGTEKGMSWLDDNPFLASINLMAPYWMWRAIGGAIMFIAHLVFAWNIYTQFKTHQKLVTNEI